MNRKTGLTMLLFFIFMAQSMAEEIEGIEEPPPGAAREEIREYRIKLKRAILKHRDEARKKHNLLLGPVLPIKSQMIEAGSNPHGEVLSPSLGMSVGYRTHFMRKLGIKTNAQLAVGPTLVSLVFDDTVTIDNHVHILGSIRSSGSGGVTYSTGINGYLVIGPLGRISIEPGMGILYTVFTKKFIYVDGEAGFGFVDLTRNPFYLTGQLGGAVYLGKKDQINLNFGIQFGGDKGDPDYVLINVYAGLDYAFGFGK